MRLVLCLLLVMVSSVAADEIYVRVDVPSEPSWVGQQVLVPVTVALSKRPSGSPEFRIPEVSGGVMVFIPGPIYGREEIDGVSYTTWTYSLAFYAHRQGEHSVPEIVVTARVPRGDGSWQRVTASTKSFVLNSRLPVGAEGISSLITTPKLTVEESWTPERSEVQVGDAITRSITLQAPAVIGMGFPPLVLKAPDGVATYPKPAKVEDEAYRGDIKGQRVETVVYVCEKVGTVVIPAVTIPWFDPEAKRLNRIELPARTLNIIPNPAFVGRADYSNVSGGVSWRFAWRVLGGLLALFVVSALTLKFTVPKLRCVASRLATFRRYLRDPLPPLNPSSGKDIE